MPLERQRVGLGLGLQRGASPPAVFSQKRLQFDLRQPTGHQQPAVIRHHDHLGPASLKKRTDPADQIANFRFNAAGQLPALVVAALVERAGFRPGRPGRVSGFV